MKVRGKTVKRSAINYPTLAKGAEGKGPLASPVATALFLT